MHSGSNYALFPDRPWHGRQTSHVPRSGQIAIRKHFEFFADTVKERRKDKRVILVHNGDAIDGDHHSSGDVCTLNQLEQADIHIELMNEFQKRMGWNRGDRLYYTRGTNVHVTDFEPYIGEQLNAVMDGNRAWELLQLVTNGVLSWFVHHGPKKGRGANRGNALRNWLRSIYYDALQDDAQFPRIVYSGHVHDPDYSVYTAQCKGFQFVNMHAIILPSWQMKTRFAWEKAPVSVNRIGGVLHEIKADGTIRPPEFIIMKT